MKPIKNVYLSAIHQNAGKTTIALGLYKILKDRGFKAAFMKPIGQKVVTVHHKNVDKDSYLIGKIYHCWRFKDMSPVTVGRGFTEQYIFKPRGEILRSQILKSFKALSKNHNVMIVEGTGHAGVGSVIDLSNADVASMLGSKVIIISGGGVGRSIDEIMLNKALFDLKGVEVLGVIINKVRPEKYQKVKRVLEQGLKNKGIRLLGVIPSDPILSSPTMEQIMNQLGLKLLCGKKNLSKHVEHAIVAAMEPHNMMAYIQDGTLVITSGDRIDNMLVSISAHLMSKRKKFKIAGIILTGGLVPDRPIIELLKESKIPVLLSKEDTYKVAGKIETSTFKIDRTDKDKILEATHLVRKNVDINLILKHL